MRLFRRDAPADTPPEPPPSERVDATDAGISSEVRLSPGGAAELLNVSESGLLVEGKTRLSTGSKVLVTITGREAKRLNARVVRCQVCAIHRDGTMTYQTALALDEPAGLEEIALEQAAAARLPEAAAVPDPASLPEVLATEPAVQPEPVMAVMSAEAAAQEFDVPHEVPTAAPVELPPDVPPMPLPEATQPASVLPRLVNQW